MPYARAAALASQVGEENIRDMKDKSFMSAVSPSIPYSIVPFFRFLGYCAAERLWQAAVQAALI